MATIEQACDNPLAMTSIVRMIRNLEDRPVVQRVPGVELRPFRDEGDIDRWLEIRHKAFSRQRLGVRSWTRADFRREFLDKPWWQPEMMWFAEAPMLRGTAPPGEHDRRSVGTVALTLREAGSGAVTDHQKICLAIHWLAVLPGWRRRGIGRLLVQSAERRCWELGYRRIGLETHRAWREAVALYEQLGYRPEPRAAP